MEIESSLKVEGHKVCKPCKYSEDGYCMRNEDDYCAVDECRCPHNQLEERHDYLFTEEIKVTICKICKDQITKSK